MNPLLVHKSNYAATIRTWGKFVPPERFLVVFMDDIKAQPHSVLSEVFAFLGVTDRPQAFRKAEMPVHVGDKQQMPDGVRKILRKKAASNLRRPFSHISGRVDGWMARYYGTI
ncbi:MAG: sulfotransferase domain-containing protein [Rhizomicrobium sp.]